MKLEEKNRLKKSQIIESVAPNIAAAQKLIRLWKENRFLASCSLKKNISCLRNRHLVLWLLGTLTGQQKFCGSGLVK